MRGIIQNQVIGVTPLVLSHHALYQIICTEGEAKGFANVYYLLQQNCDNNAT